MSDGPDRMPGPTLEEEKDMDEQNTAQQVPGVLVDTGPTDQDVLQARMVLEERSLMDRMATLRKALADEAAETSPPRLQQMVQHLVNVEQRLVQLRQLRGDW